MKIYLPGFNWEAGFEMSGVLVTEKLSGSFTSLLSLKSKITVLEACNSPRSGKRICKNCRF